MHKGKMKYAPIGAVMLLVVSLSFAESVMEPAVSPGVIFELLALNKDLPTPAQPKYLSPTDLVPSPDGKLLFVAEQTAKRIDVVDVAQQVVIKRLSLPNEVTGIAVSPDGRLLYATCSSDLWSAGRVCIVDIAAGKVTSSIAVGNGARAPVINPDGSRLFVCNRFDNDVSIIDLFAQQESARIAVVREPYCAAITPDGKTLVVGNLLPDDRSTDTLFISSTISIIDIARQTQDTIRLTRGSHSVFGLSVSADGKYAFATHQIGKFNLIGTTVEKGHLNTNNIAVIDIGANKLVNDVCLDLSLVGLGDPWGIACSNDGEFMVVAHAGANELSIIHLPELIDTVLARTSREEDMQRDFASMLDSRKRVTVKTKCPRALAIIDNKIYVAGYFSDTAAALGVYDLSLTTTAASGQILLDQPQLQTSQRKGEALFYDASLCFQRWQTCNSCHTLTRSCGLNWILGGGAIVAPKNSKSMLYTWWTPPATWNGRRGDAYKAISWSIELELFRVSTEELTLPLDTFIMNIKPVASPYLHKGRLSEAATRGKSIFFGEKAQCFQCHSAPLFCDLKYHDAGVPDPYDINTSWDTPSLIEAWRTWPYGHLGSFSNIREIIELPGHNNASLHLSTDELNDLAEYVLSL